MAGLGKIPRLADVIRQKAQEAATKKRAAPNPHGVAEAAATKGAAVLV